eukprot:TRINITY_DN5413_c0_g1_i1.p1 TRINITY_DN5413_c0_g1~~TRINITY_DN5413_c0_g1_i1.p1  ORF type:complete len:296 (+),score=13.34 TRINITY_DN5413_c0_g1_i1:110-997(+)
MQNPGGAPSGRDGRPTPPQRTAAGSGRSAVQAAGREPSPPSSAAKTEGAAPRPPHNEVPSQPRPQGVGVSRVLPGAPIFGPGARGVVSAAMHQRYNSSEPERAGPPRAAAGPSLFAGPGRGAVGVRGQRVLRLPHFAAQAAAPGASNHETPPNAPQLSLGQYVLVCERRTLETQLGPNWSPHYLAVVNGMRVGAIYRRSNNVFFVHFMDDADEFPFALTLPYGALTPYEGRPPESLEAFVKRRPAPAVRPSSTPLRHGAPRGVVMPHGPAPRHVHHPSHVTVTAGAGRSRTCAVM